MATDQVAKLRRRFGPSPSADALSQLSWRDAAERVDKLALEDQAIRLLHQGLDNADEPLTRTILRTAIDQHWAGVVSLYVTARHPDHAAVEALWVLTHDEPLPRADRNLIAH